MAYTQKEGTEIKKKRDGLKRKVLKNNQKQPNKNVSFQETITKPLLPFTYASKLFSWM